jgi:hypothetical protein
VNPVPEDQVATKATLAPLVETARVEPAAHRDESHPPGTNEPETGTNSGRGRTAPAWLGDRIVYALMAAAIAATGIVNAGSLQADIVRHGGQSLAFWKPLLWEFSSGLVVFLLLPLVREAVRRATASDRTLAVAAAIHLSGAIVFSATHVIGMVAFRKAAYWSLSLGSYSFDFSAANLLYEARKDVITYVLVASAFWLIDRWRRSASAAASTALPPTEPARTESLWLRDGTTNIRIAPEDIVWVASAGNYVEYSLADGRKRLIRATLAEEEQRLAAYAIVRVHRTRLLNARRIREWTVTASGNLEIKLDTDEIVAGSRTYRSVLERLGGASARKDTPPQQNPRQK